MKRTLIRYKTRPELADKNAELIAARVRGIEGRKARRRSLSFAAARRRYLRAFRRDGIRFRSVSYRDWPPSRRSRAGFASAASNRRSPVASQSSAITGCWPNRELYVSGSDNGIGSESPLAAADIERLLAEMRPKLHRYCARMVGSVIDGEDVLQDALIKAVESFASTGGSAIQGLAVPDRAQHRAGFSAPPQPAGSAPLGRGGGHDCRSGR